MDTIDLGVYLLKLMIGNKWLLKVLHITSPELPPMVVQYSGHVSLSVSRDQYTALSLLEVLVT